MWGSDSHLTGTNTSDGVWTAPASPANPAGATLSSTSGGVATVSFASSSSGVFKFVYTANGCTDTVQVSVTAKPNAGADQVVCAGQTATLTGTNTSDGVWTAQASPANPAGATLGTTTSGVARVDFARTAVGVFYFVYTANNCTDTVKITVNAKPEAGADSIGMAAICNTVSTIDLPNAKSGESWSQLGNMPKSVTINATTGVVTGMEAIGTYQFILKNTNTNCADTVAVEVRNCRKGFIGDFVWKDLNNDGIQQETEPKVKGVILQLLNADNNTILATDTTNVDGIYGFGELEDGRYKVKILKSSLPALCVLSDSIDKGINDAYDSDFNPVTGKVLLLKLKHWEKV
ncbi:MAG: SdrD B-like domain-containing protein [Spirosomataceae bacterium]